MKLPYDTHLEWAGEINQLNETTGRLMVIIPLTLLLIAFLVYSSVKNWKDMVDRARRAFPCACSGGVVALLVTAHDLLDLGGDGLHLDLRRRHPGRAHRRAPTRSACGTRAPISRRARSSPPSAACARCSMTTFVAMIGLLPAALSHGIGSETQKPLAIVVIGGALMLAILPRLLQPALLVLMHRHEPRWDEPDRGLQNQRT